jgi:hypothetical protein
VKLSYLHSAQEVINSRRCINFVDNLDKKHAIFVVAEGDSTEALFDL